MPVILCENYGKPFEFASNQRNHKQAFNEVAFCDCQQPLTNKNTHFSLATRCYQPVCVADAEAVKKMDGKP